LRAALFSWTTRLFTESLIKAFLIDSPGWAWIEPHDMTENGRNAYLAWIAHYNGEGELSKRAALAKAKLENLHYKNEGSMSFEICTEILTKCFNTLHKDPDQRYSDRRKVKKLLKAIRFTDAELLAAKVIVDQHYSRDFAAAAVSFPNKFPESIDQLSWSTDKPPNPVHAAFMPLPDKQAAADWDEAAMEDAMAAEVVDEAADADGRMITRRPGTAY
jgi:hypothetical protein